MIKIFGLTKIVMEKIVGLLVKLTDYLNEIFSPTAQLLRMRENKGSKQLQIVRYFIRKLSKLQKTNEQMRRFLPALLKKHLARGYRFLSFDQDYPLFCLDGCLSANEHLITPRGDINTDQNKDRAKNH